MRIKIRNLFRVMCSITGEGKINSANRYKGLWIFYVLLHKEDKCNCRRETAEVCPDHDQLYSTKYNDNGR